MYQIKVTIHHALGTFTGYLSPDDPNSSLEEVHDILDGLGKKIVHATRLALTTEDGSIIVFNEKVLSECIPVLKICEVDE